MTAGSRVTPKSSLRQFISGGSAAAIILYEAALGLGIDTVEMDGALSSEQVNEADIVDGLYDGATVQTLIVNWNAPDEFAVLQQATVAKLTRIDTRFVAELEGPGRALDFVRGRTIERHCSAELGDAHVAALLGLGDAAAMERLAQRIVAEGLSVRTVEEIVALGMDPEKPRRSAPRAGRYSPQLDDLAGRLSDRLDTRVKAASSWARSRVSIQTWNSPSPAAPRPSLRRVTRKPSISPSSRSR